MRIVHDFKIWGYISDCNGMKVSGKPVHLLKKITRVRGNSYKEMDVTYSDGDGYYEFIIRNMIRIGDYKIVILKSSEVRK